MNISLSRVGSVCMEYVASWSAQSKHHAIVDSAQLRSRLFPRLKLESHRAAELIDVLKTHSFAKFPSPMQSHAVEEWARYYERWMRTNDRTRSVEEMQELIRIFSRLFFGGMLGNAAFAWVPDLCKAENILGDCDRRSKGERTWAKIRMDPADVHSAGGGLSHEMALVCTLLHECVHAYIWMYFCHLRCTDEGCQRDFYSMYGSNGHGSAFCCIASHIEVLASEVFRVNIVIDFWKNVAMRYGTDGQLPDDREINDCHPRHAVLLRIFRDKTKLYRLHTPDDRRGLAYAFVQAEGAGLIRSYSAQ